MSTASSEDLADAFQDLRASLVVLFTFYQSYIKLALYAFLSWICYRIGHVSISDEILTKKSRITSLILKKNSLKIDIPKKIEKLQKSNKIIIIFTLIALTGIAVAHFVKYIKIVKYEILIIGTVLLLIVALLIVLNIFKFYLNRKIKKADSLDKEINTKMVEFQKSLGDKVIAILKNHLCRRRENNSSDVNSCKKSDCKQLRALYKIRNESMFNLIEETINFEWCSVCKKRQPFDEYLPFQFKDYVAHSETEEGQVKERIIYLVEGLERMREWIVQTNPCNCAKLYWNLSTQQIIAYKKNEKGTENKIKSLESKNKKI